MQMARNMFLAIFISTVLALMLSFLPLLKKEQEPELALVFKEVVELNKDNLVDILSSINSNYQMTHVDWENQNLFIDFKIDAEKPVYLDDIFEDLFHSVFTAYSRTRNVEGLYVRFIYDQKGKPEVLIALSSEKTEDLVEELGKVRSLGEKKDFLSQHTRLSYGVLWKEKHVN